MLKEAKLAMRITGSAYDADIADLLDAAASDLTTAGVELPGTVVFTMTNSGIVDSSTLNDKLVIRAMITYARMHFGSPDDFDRLKEAYREQKAMLMHAHAYTDYGDGGEDDGEG